MRSVKAAKTLSCVLSCVGLVSLAGCAAPELSGIPGLSDLSKIPVLSNLAAISDASDAEQVQEASPEDVTLLEPVGVAEEYEIASVSTLYDAKIVSGIVCPYVEEYELEQSFRFAGYDVYPGQTVEAGGVILHGDTTSYDERIEELQKAIVKADEDYIEYVQEMNESLRQPRTDFDNTQNVLDYYEDIKPPMTIEETQYVETGEVEEDGTPIVEAVTVEVDNPEFAQWHSEYNRFDREHRTALQTIMEGEEALRQREELHWLDREYNLLQLAHLGEDRSGLILTSKMRGTVMNLSMWNQDAWLPQKSPLVAVGDTGKKIFRCAYISETTVSRAEDIYLIVDGKRYEVEYVPMPNGEYTRLLEAGVKVYSSFRIQDKDREIEQGSFAVLVMRNRTVENVLTVPQSAVKKDDSGYYVYVIEGEKNVYTPVQVGMRDGVYAEILSGVKEGDKILTESPLTASKGITATLEYGSLSNSYIAPGFLYYPAGTYVKNPVKYGTCYLVETCVKRYEQVKAGQLLAKVRVVPDGLAQERLSRQILREQERLLDIVKQDKPEENEKIIAAKEERIQELYEELQKMQADMEITEIRAPVAGIATFVTSLEGGDIVGSEGVLYVISNEKQSYLYVEDAEQNLYTYGNRVNVYYTNEENEQGVAEGKVVTLNSMALSEQLADDYALIQVSGEDLAKLFASIEDNGNWWNMRFRTELVHRSMEDVLLVPKQAVIASSGRTYVRVRQPDGRIQMVSFIAGGSDANNYWVVEGLTEGMEICLE